MVIKLRLKAFNTKAWGIVPSIFANDNNHPEGVKQFVFCSLYQTFSLIFPILLFLGAMPQVLMFQTFSLLNSGSVSAVNKVQTELLFDINTDTKKSRQKRDLKYLVKVFSTK